MPSDQVELRKSGIARRETLIAKSDASSAGELVNTGTAPLPLIEDDKDLVPLLRQASNEELEPLVQYIVEKGGLTAQIQRTRLFKHHSSSGNHQMYADDIAAEIQKFGANTFGSWFRDGRGKKYRKILKDVAKRCRVPAHYWNETVEIEERVLAAVLSKAYERMTDEQRREMLDSLEIHKLPGARAPITAGALQAAIQAGGFAPYKLAVIVANGTANAVLGHGLALATNAGITKGLAMCAGPIGWALDAIWGSVVLAGPAYRVTLPCVVQVALIRQSMLDRRRKRSLRILGIIGIALLIALTAIAAAHHFMR